eukprot:CAMPEP_0174379470 /NCGR_PEP_ID=MMETSP0811_2-20130205/122735_1 /TAXON_ID=73025 ORGANISM="Eutreptiella gymnastica-like, Strain CCMP1594" /NCGR_SAMPLE_ID=MMETSP0811_2 /ASSEMBLY_ACC=CAM_ASM_000667 /LENGTH=69 /DNA_ID=CAMNT_0015532027 /DNA_START=2250 /DNA_END=2459 /DNA_ORIENTATION=+
MVHCTRTLVLKLRDVPGTAWEPSQQVVRLAPKVQTRGLFGAFKRAPTSCAVLAHPISHCRVSPVDHALG